MVKALIFVAVVADIFLIVSSTGQQSRSEARAEAHASSSTHSKSGCTCNPPKNICKGDNEIFDECAPPCPPEFCDVNIALILCIVPPKPGDPDCEARCRCIDGYARNSSGVCIPRDKCPKCPPNEEYVQCLSQCPRRRCDSDDRLIKCAKPLEEGDPNCVPGCRCADGFFRNSWGTCVTRDECPSCDGPNEIYACGGACDNVCETLHIQNQTNCPIVNIRCNDKCYCKNGYARDKNNICIPIEKCPTPNCGKHGVYSDCIQGQCRPKNCTEVGSPIACPRIDPAYCKKGCICEEGYARTKTGECVPVDKCPPNCGKHGIYSDCIQGQCRPKNCTEVGSPIACPKIDPAYCQKGCICEEGYARTKTGECVPVDKCPPNCGKHGVYSDCIQGQCRPKNCTEVGSPIACPKIDPAYCQKGCICEEGYARTKTGECVPVDKCPPNCGKHGVYSDCIQGQCRPKNCTEVGSPIACPKIDPAYCQKGCICEEGYARTKTGECVPVDKCPPNCGKHGVYSDCIQGQCRPKNCTEVGSPIACPRIDPAYCKKGCICEEGYARTKTGECVPVDKCPPNCGKHGVYSDCIQGQCRPKNCTEVGSPNACPRIDPAYCQKGCICEEGYARTKTGECVPVDKCPPICGKDEESSECVNGGCSAKNCSQIGRPIACVKINSKDCIKGCLCKKGYLRESNGVCVKEEKCKPPTCGKNKVYENCTKPRCRAHKCSELGLPLNCTHPPPCQKGCVCKPGYVTNDQGHCIPVQECPPVCSEYEVRDPCINGGCKIRNCSELGGPTICTHRVKCKPGCTCKDGYLRMKDGKCVPILKCPSAQCGKYEQFHMCPAAVCGPKHCNQLGFPVDCPEVKDNICPGLPGCICIDGYVRNKDGKCIPKRKCPSCGGDRHAWSGCRVCGRNCEDIDGKPKICPRICLANACECRDGYYYDNVLGQCVTKDCCTSTCRANETYDFCANGGCRYRSCSELGGPMLCIDPNECEGGCSCNEGFVRLEATGVCIAEEDCPTPNCGDNASYDFCVNGGCRYRYCSELGRPMPCIDPIECEKGCSCNKGFVRLDATGECVAEEDCPCPCTKPNEEYVKCPSSCTPVTCKGLNQTYHCPLMKVNQTDCIGECRCISGFFRNAIGECISKDDCNKCPKKYEYSSCGPPCDNVCSELHKQSKDNCPIKNKKCTSKCYCEDGYARNGNGTCVKISECPVDAAPVNSTIAIANFEQGNIKLAVNFLCDLLDSKPGENFMFSAFSVLIALAQLTLYAIGLSAEQLLALLNLKNKDEIRTIFPILIKNYESQQEVTFDLAIKYYGNLDYIFSEQFKSDAINIFASEGQNINFADNVPAAAEINQWVANHTNQRIQNLVNPSMFNANTEVVFVNAMYFLGKWISQFNKQNTQPREFYLNDNDKVTIPIMYQQNTFKYAENEALDAKILKLPYKGNFSLYVFLPNQKTGLRKMATELQAPGIFTSSIKSMRSEKVNVYMPLMNFSTDIPELIKLLQMNNVTAPFVPGNNFKGITVDNKPLAITDAIQKSVFIVNENGTEAAVATGIIVSRTAAIVPREIYTFNVNHPCAFFLCLDDDPMFAGAFVGAT